ncbi:potassium-transporting ATPase subunit KdpA, partial [Mycobacterium tuberculosis]|nr:potassium-transporting ATPase subunit KdpA [Mycobacterium tuberculosis]
MNAFIIQLAIYLVVLLVLAKPLGAYMTGVFGDKPSRTHWLGPVERLFYRVAGVNPKAEMG